jgi:hypothetical protein
MKSSRINRIRAITIHFLFIIIPVIVFYLFIFIKLPIQILETLSRNSLFFLIIFFLLNAASFNLKGSASYFASFLLISIVFASPFAYNLHTGYSDAAVIGGFIPYKDGFYYFNGARTILLGRPILYGWNDIFRPLFPGFLASLLYLLSNNLVLVQTLIILIMGFSVHAASLKMNDLFGKWPAALFISLMTVYSRQFIGYTWTELPSVIFGCFSIMFLLVGAEERNIFKINFGAMLLVISLSIRAGAFMMLPLLPFWVGFIFWSNKESFLREGVLTFLIISTTFLMANLVIPRVITTGSSTFGNFAYTLYGQAKGGAIWNQAIIDLNTTDTSIIMQEALNNIRRYPAGIIIGTVKAYLDFLGPNKYGLFHFVSPNSFIVKILFWFICICLSIKGIYYCFRTYKKEISSLFLICLFGLLFSIPFVPPVGNGNRLYSGSAPITMALPVIGLFALLHKKSSLIGKSVNKIVKLEKILYLFSILLLLLVLIMPIILKQTGKAPLFSEPICNQSQIPFAAQIYPGSFVDVQKNEPVAINGSFNISVDKFEKFGADKINDDFFLLLIQKSKSSNQGIRIAESVDLISSQYYFFIGTPDLLPEKNNQNLVLGCATKIENKYQQALWIERIIEQVSF